MAFEEFMVVTGNPAKGPNTVSISITGRNGDETRSKNLSLVVVFGPDVLKTCDWNLGDKLAVYFGTGEDKGKALLKKSDQPTATVLTLYNRNSQDSETPKALKLQRAIKAVAPIADFINLTMPIERVAFKWDEEQKGLMVDLPKGFFQKSETPSSL